MSARRGFTLIEVMISIAILALGLSIVFGSSVMAARATAHSRMLTNASMLAQCRMAGAEAYLRQNQLPQTDQTYDDPPETGGLRCCEAPFTCTARVEIIQLPDPQALSQNAGDRLLNAASGAAQGSSFGGIAAGDGGLSGGLGSLLGGDGGTGNPMDQLAGALGSLGSMAGTGGASDPMAGLAGGAGGTGAPGGLAGAGAPSLQTMASALLAGIYPTIKPLLEGAIRKVTVVVSWDEGTRPFDLTVTQYYTNPGQTLQSGDTLNAIDRMMGGVPGANPGGSATPGSTSTPGTTAPPPGATH